MPRILPKKTVKDQIEGENGYLFDEMTGYVYELNETGSKIWLMVKMELTYEEIVEKISQEYDVDRSILERDVKEFLDKLMKYGVVEVVNDNCSSHRA
jgi:transcription antitermination factor NusA-like protein